RLAYELARRSDLQVYGIEPDAAKTDESRRALDRAGAYGHRVTIVQADLNELPFSNYFANLVVSDSLLLTGELPSRATEIARSIKPCGGVICLGAPPSAPGAAKITSDKRRTWLTDLTLAPDEDIKIASSFASLTRGKLSGVGEWSHQYGNVANTSTSSDYRVKGGMGVLWYGDPGPAPMINRHEGASAPLSTNGRMFIQGLDSILCYDAYNGTFLWEYKNPGALRTGVFNNEETSNLAASDDALFVAVDDTCTEVVAATGKVRAVHKTPASEDKIPRVWGYVGYWNGMLFGTSTIRKDLEQSLRRRGHTVANTTDAIFAVDVKTGERKWVYRGQNIMHVTIAIGDDRAFFIDSSISQQQRDELLRQDKTELKNLGEEEAKKKEAELKALDVRLAVAVLRGQREWPLLAAIPLWTIRRSSAARARRQDGREAVVEGRQLSPPPHRRRRPDHRRAVVVRVAHGRRETTRTSDYRRGNEMAVQPPGPSLRHDHGDSEHVVLPQRLYRLLRSLLRQRRQPFCRPADGLLGQCDSGQRAADDPGSECRLRLSVLDRSDRGHGTAARGRFMEDRQPGGQRHAGETTGD
ncbi:MAG: methyltransferase domain-containing protein, partial [Planctomycetia bacterium]|nr:methyltransferase domain-containing protein [Planctomycetia bacterium]